jgi:hypothetical protein
MNQKPREGLLSLIFPTSFLTAPCLVEIRSCNSIIFKRPVIGTKLYFQVQKGDYYVRTTYMGWISEKIHVGCYPDAELIVPDAVKLYVNRYNKEAIGLRYHAWNAIKRKELIAEYANIHYISTPPRLLIWNGVRSVDAVR